MKKILDLKEERNLAFMNMEAITKKAETETRNLNESEIAEWKKFDDQIRGVDKQLEILERQEELKLNAVRKAQPKNIVTPEEKLAKRFDLFKALKQVTRSLDGVEAEVQQEGLKEMRESGVITSENAFYIPSNLIKMEKRVYSEVGTGDGTPPIKTDASNILSIVRTPIIMDQLGVTSYPNLTGNFKIPKMGQLTAAFVSEKSAVDTAGVALATDTLAPRRIGGGDRLSKELLAQTSPQIQNDILTDFVNSIYRGVQKDLIRAVPAAGTILSSHAITDTPAALTHAFILALEAGIEIESDNYMFVCSPAQKALLKALKLDSGSASFAWMNNEVNGYKAFATSALTTTNGGSTNTAFDVILGNWKAAVYGQWGGIEMIVNPYTYAKEGEIELTVNGLFDTGVANALYFSIIRNATA